MEHCDVRPFTITPAAALISRCVSVGLITQEEVNSCGQQPVFSSRFYQVEQEIEMQKELDELRLELELLQLERRSADVTHPYFLTRRFEMLQRFSSHLQDVLKEKNQLMQRLMRQPTSLPVHADLHRIVVDTVKIMMDFIERLREKLDVVRTRPAATESLTQLSYNIARALDQVHQLQTVSAQIFQRKEVGSSLLSDSSSR